MPYAVIFLSVLVALLAGINFLISKKTTERIAWFVIITSAIGDIIHTIQYHL